MILLVSERRPLFFFGVTGVVLLLIAGLLGLYTIQMYYASKVFAIGYAMLFLLFAVVGVLTAFTGIVLNAMRRQTVAKA